MRPPRALLKIVELLVPDTEAGSGVRDLKQRVTLGHILGLRNCDVGRLDDQTVVPPPPAAVRGHRARDRNRSARGMVVVFPFCVHLTRDDLSKDKCSLLREARFTCTLFILAGIGNEKGE